jgi:DNA-binding NarL/FixJ family response regulator
VAVPRAFVARMIDELRGRERRRRHLDLRERRRVELTAREWEVVELLRQRLSTHEIAVRLGISQVTVRRHLSGVLQKVGVATRDEVLRLLEDDER